MTPETVTIAGAMAATGLGKNTIYQLINSGELQSLKIGRRRLVRFESIRRLTGAEQATGATV